jgi:hypothetical protein
MIFVTGGPSERNSMVSELPSDNGLLLKPFDPAELLRALDAAAKEKAAVHAHG